MSKSEGKIQLIEGRFSGGMRGNTMDMQPGVRIRQLREAKHYTRDKLADEVGITSKFLYEIERGGRNFSAETLCRLAQALSVSCDYIMLGENEEEQGIARLIYTLEKIGPTKLHRIQTLLETLDAVCDIEE